MPIVRPAWQTPSCLKNRTDIEENEPNGVTRCSVVGFCPNQHMSDAVRLLDEGGLLGLKVPSALGGSEIALKQEVLRFCEDPPAACAKSVRFPVSLGFPDISSMSKEDEEDPERGRWRPLQDSGAWDLHENPIDEKVNSLTVRFLCQNFITCQLKTWFVFESCTYA